jgi:uncharacterized protein (TIGR03437 family)
LSQAQVWGASELLSNRQGENDAYTGVGRLSGNGTCTGFLLRATNAPTASTPAYVVTNGHCVDRSSANAIVAGAAFSGRVVFRFFHDTIERQLAAAIRRTAYSTMKAVDVAVLELNSTYTELLDAAVRPLAVSSTPASGGDDVITVGAPVSNIPAEESFLRLARCTLDPPVDLIEWIWRFWRALPNRCSDIHGGSSGSPMIAAGSGQVVALINTSTVGAPRDSGAFPCSLNQPCEVASGGFRYRQNTNYAVPIHGLAACFDAQGVFDLTRSGCPLDPGRQLTLSTPAIAMQPGKATWNVRVSGAAWPFYRYKTVREGHGDCRDPGGYGPALAVSETSRIDDALPAEQGRYYLCVVGMGSASGESAQPLKFVSMVHARVDGEPPVPRSRYSFQDTGAEFVIQPVFLPPEIVDFRYKINEGQSPCGNSADYLPYRRVPIRVTKATKPESFCLIAVDEAGNAGEPLEIALRGTQLQPYGVVNAASYEPGPAAPGQWISLFGVNLTDVRLRLTDSEGNLLNLTVSGGSPVSANALLPPQIAMGPASLVAEGADGTAQAALDIEAAAPGLFSAAASGLGAASAVATRIYTDGSRSIEPAFTCSSAAFCTPSPVNLPAASEQVILTLFATGLGVMRLARDVAATIAGVSTPVLAVRQTRRNPGVDEVDIRITSSFRLRGFLPVTLRVGGKTSNQLFVRFR